MKKWLIFICLATTLLATACGSDETDAVSEAETAAEDTRVVNTEIIEASLAAPAPSGHSFQPNLADANIDMAEVVALLPPDAIPAILPDRVPEILVTAQQANESGIDPSVRVIGVSINGESQAFPIPHLSRHEIVNTEIGGRKLAVTW